jgi:hypothetical protein
MKRCLACGTSRQSRRINRMGLCDQAYVAVCARGKAKRGNWTIAWRQRAQDRIAREEREKAHTRRSA